MVNEAEYDPFLKRQTERIEHRLDNPEEATKRATDRFTEASKSAGRGQLRGAAANLAQSGGNLSAVARRKMKRAQGEARAGGKASIEVGREKAEDDMVLGASGALGAVGDAGRADRAAALEDHRLKRRAFESARQLDLAARAQKLQNWMTQFEILDMAGGM